MKTYLYKEFIPKSSGLAHTITEYNWAVKTALEHGFIFAHYPIICIDNEVSHGIKDKLNKFFDLDSLLNYKDIPKNIKVLKIPMVFKNVNLKSKEVAYVLPDMGNNCKYKQPFHTTRNWWKSRYYEARKKYPIKSYFNTNKINIGVHIRRGDILPGEVCGQHSSRLNPDSYFTKIINKIVDTYPKGDFVAHVYSEDLDKNRNTYCNEKGEPADISKEIKCETEYHINEDQFVTFHHLVISDILITSASYFSFLASVLNDNIIMAHTGYNFEYCGNHIIPVTNESEFDTSKFFNNKKEKYKDISLVTRYMNRKTFLECSLPSWVKLPFKEIVIVDWSSTEDIQPIIDKYQDGRIVRVIIEGQKFFHRTKSLNVGARFAKSKYIMHTDTDIILSEGLIDNIDFDFYKCENKKAGCYGTCIFTKDLFNKVNGYNEYMGDWGHEDNEFYERISKHSTFKEINDSKVIHIEHSNALRNFNSERKSSTGKTCLKNRETKGWSIKDKQEEFSAVVVFPNGKKERIVI